MQSQTSSTSDLSFPIENLLQNSSVIFYQCSLEKNYPIIQISSNAENVLGYKPKQFYSKSTFWMDQVHDNDHAEILQKFHDLINHKKHTLTYRFKHKDGHYIWLRDENIVNYDSEGNPQTITGTAIDITPQKQSDHEVKQLNETLEQRIEERTANLTATNRKLKKQLQYRNKMEKQVTKQQKKLRLLQAGINYINDMVIISKAPVDDPLNSKIIYTNQAFENFTGYTSSEVRRRRPSFLHGKKTQQDQLQKLYDGIKNNEHVRVEFINYKKNGTTYWVDLEMSPFPADEEGMQYWVGINRDITKRKKAEMALEENEEKYRSYTELSFDAIFEIAMDGTIIGCNARACQLFGYSKEELTGLNIKKLTPNEYQDHLPKEMSADITTGSDVVQRTYKKKDGSTFSSEINTKIFSRNEEDHLIAYVRDISEQVKYRQALEKSVREKETLLAEVHHRVKNNLAVISGLLEMQSFNAETDQIAGELKESQSRIQSIATVHEMLYQSESFSDIRLEQYIDELISYISGTFGGGDVSIRIEKDIEPISLAVNHAIPCGLLLNELITNGYKHAFDGMEEGIIFIKLHREDDTIHLDVCDNGIGLNADFDPEQSSSLGITLIKTLVRQLNGSFSWQRKPKTCFSISFEVE